MVDAYGETLHSSGPSCSCSRKSSTLFHLSCPPSVAPADLDSPHFLRLHHTPPRLPLPRMMSNPCNLVLTPKFVRAFAQSIFIIWPLLRLVIETGRPMEDLV
ncbi:unnamed protein product [Durusdinium trenchii]|uniref:Uncharacterized protein n=1 Tax=Durusdinium trenchii TaxID=1381693 RepID=A0ABP0LKF7_9DINO